jgi:hypothetical protein
MKVVIALAIIVAAIVVAAVFLRLHKRGFWSIASKHPDAAYDFFRANVCWRVFEEGLPKHYRKIVPKPHWSGPYHLIVPKIGHKTIHVFGKHPDFSRSQAEFLNKFQ